MFSVVATLAVVAVVANPAAAQKVLFHGREAGPTFGADGNVMTHLEGLFGAGNVTYMQGTAAAADGSSADGFDLVVISSTLDSGNVRNKYEDTPKGLVNWEQALFGSNTVGNFMLSTAGTTGNDVTTLTINDPTSPLAAGLSGDVVVFSQPSGSNSQLGTGALGAGVNLVASAADGSSVGSAAIFSADVGDALSGDGSDGSPATAAGRRVMFFIQDNSFNDLTPEGIALFDSAVTWAAVPEPSSALLGLLGLCGLLVARRRK